MSFWRISGADDRRQVATFLARAANLNRAGGKIQEIAARTVEALVKQGWIEEKAEGEDVFLWPSGMEDPPARVPRPGDEPRPVDVISRAEMRQVILCLLRGTIGMRQEEAVQEAARLMGFKQTGSNIRERIDLALAALELEHRIQVHGGQVHTFDDNQ